MILAVLDVYYQLYDMIIASCTTFLATWVSFLLHVCRNDHISTYGVCLVSFWYKKFFEKITF